MQTILESFKSSQMQLSSVNIPIGQNCFVTVDIICSLLYIVSDTEGADKMCGKYCCYENHKVQQQCRICNVQNTEISNPQC